MSRIVRAHLITGCENFSTISSARKMSLDVDVSVVELLHGLRLVHSATFTTRETLPFWNVLTMLCHWHRLSFLTLHH